MTGGANPFDVSNEHGFRSELASQNYSLGGAWQSWHGSGMNWGVNWRECVLGRKEVSVTFK